MAFLSARLVGLFRLLNAFRILGGLAGIITGFFRRLRYLLGFLESLGRLECV